MFTHSLACSALALLAAGAAAYAAGEGPARRSVPADEKLTITDYGYRDWGPEPVSYTLDAARAAAGVTVVDGAGAPVPSQVDGNVLTFVAAVKKGETAAYAVRAGAERAASTLAVSRAGDALEARNEFLSVRMPAPGTRSLAGPVEAAQAAPPILGWASAGGGWIGGARFHTARKVVSQAFTVLRQGPALFEYEARYRFEPAGEYVWRLRLSPGMPVAIVTEEFEFGALTNGEDLLLLDLGAGWKPQSVAWVNGSGEQGLPTLGTAEYGKYVEQKRAEGHPEAPVGGVGDAPRPYEPEKGLVLLEKLFPAGLWGGLKGGIQLRGDAPDQPAVGVVPLHAGSWRRAMALNVWERPGDGMTVGLPISVRYSRWSLETTDDHSPFSTHEHDPGLKESYGRRVWALTFGSEPSLVQPRYGYIGLDRYKDWILDTPEGKTRTPGAFFSPQQIAGIKKAFDQHPDAAFLKTWYLFSGDPQDAIKHAQRVIEGLKHPYQENDLFLAGLSNYRKSQFLAFTCLAEDALACPELPADLRQELRRRLALYAYITSDPDFNPRGAGVHLGNNNMTINRTLALSYFAGLLPDHPLYSYWMGQVRAFAQYKYATQFAPDGVNIECPSYSLYSPFRTLNVTQNILRNRGIADLGKEEYHSRYLRWLSNLTMPDPRWQSPQPVPGIGLRIIPGMGNSSNQLENVWGFSMAGEVERDPKFAGWLRFMNRLCNGTMPLEPGPNYHDNVKSTPHALYYLPYVPENPEPLATTFLPTYGVIFRSGFNTPNETAMLFRAGSNWGHWDTDPLNVILYGKAAPLSPGTEYQYFSGDGPWSNNGVYHNQVKVGRRDLQEVFGRVDGSVADYGFGPSADYAVADRHYPPQLFDDGKGGMSWRRHVLFVKTGQAEGSSYFVMRDTFPGEARPTWWNWLNLETPERILVEGKAFAKEAPVNKTVPEAEMPAQRGQAIEMRTDYGASTWFWFSEPREVRIRMIAEYPRQDGKPGKQQKTVVEIPGAPGQDYLYAVTPRKDGAPAPECKALAAGVLSVKTAESQDTLFLGDAPFAYDREGITFTGKAGAVRLFADRVALCLNAGTGRVGYKGYVLEGAGPFERTVRLAGLKPGLHPVAGGYEKKPATADLGNGVKVSGEGPFTAKLEGETIRIYTSGRARVLHVTQPPFIVRPQYLIDGQEWMACWTDYPASGWGTYDNTWLIALTVPDGDHDLVVRNLVFPPVWARPFTPAIAGVEVGGGGDPRGR